MLGNRAAGRLTEIKPAAAVARSLRDMDEAALAFLFWALVLLGLAAAVRCLTSAGLHGSGFGPNAALDTLRQRYARGEIGRDEYEQMRRDLAD